jgi:hypothetical protein
LKRNKEINCFIGRKNSDTIFFFFQIFGKILNLIRFIVSWEGHQSNFEIDQGSEKKNDEPQSQHSTRI